MQLFDLLKAVQGGALAFDEHDHRFSDIIRILDNEGAGVLEASIRIITTERDGELGRCTSVICKGLSQYGYQLLDDLAGKT
ncbi:hypothetical protein JR065_07395 [Xanthomonas sp. AmX2]|uniref:hypothetical protein n=1 Tax=Xanthomonas sp. TaxID=29446 RepID=UPI0019817028|nr:hypothetical protein [Xanthomonas sp.]MBN6150161.1 hypothetical protein [Xanthomonas sp.]